MKYIGLLILAISLTGCIGITHEISNKCPKIKPLKFSLVVDKRGGLDRKNRLKATKAISYLNSEIIRTNQVVDSMND